METDRRDNVSETDSAFLEPISILSDDELSLPLKQNQFADYTTWHFSRNRAAIRKYRGLRQPQNFDVSRYLLIRIQAKR